ncbi:MAG TPA: hydrogenase expression/formation protein HypE [Pirellulales bacterium]|nr:hydrogenase expression/formation protein HypE [Pirellulales bacterium]
MAAQRWQTACPLPAPAGNDLVTLAHGEGGLASRKLIQERIVPRLQNEILAQLGDAATLPKSQYPLAFSADSFVVSPLFFPGGDIGTLAVFGTANDLAMAGARPRWLSLSLILEEGLPLTTLDSVLNSIAESAAHIDVSVVTGDTKVVPRGAADGMFIQTTGIGELMHPPPPGPAAITPGDELIVSGPIGQHGIAVLVARERLAIEPPPESDCGPLLAAVDAIRSAGIDVRAMRDATRGGAAAVLHEWAAVSRCSMAIDEQTVPISAVVRGTSELLGLDPLHIANEGTMLLAVAAGEGARAVEALARLPRTARAAVIGGATSAAAAPVIVKRALGRYQRLDEPFGAPLPRIC